MTVSPEEIDAAMTPAGGFTKATLETWGVPWPPPKGWRARLIAEWKAANDSRENPQP